MRTLDLRGNKIDPSKFSHLNFVLRNHLIQTLDIGNNQITGEGAQYIANIVRHSTVSGYPFSARHISLT